MNNAVKEFIENNINIIEQDKWLMLFMNWYGNPHKEFPDSLQFSELMEILSIIDKEIYSHTKKYRQGVVITMTRANIEDIRNYLNLWTNDDKVSLSHLMLVLSSTLGLDKDDVVDCIQDAAEAEGLTYDATKEEFSGLKR